MNDKIFKTLGSSSHTKEERENSDYYATSPKAVEHLLNLNEIYNLGLDRNKIIWECACGEKHLTNVLLENGFNVRNSDIINRTQDKDIEIIDFLNYEGKWEGDIITNPPYSYAQDFVEKSLEIINDGSKIIMFLKVLFLEGQKRKKLFENNPPKYIFISSSRLLCAKNGDFEEMKKSGGSAIAYAWFYWEKGYKGDTIVKWFN